MAFDAGRFFRACNPSKTLNLTSPADKQYYIDFSAVRGSDLVQELKRTITLSGEEPTCPCQIRSELANELQALMAQAAVDVAPFELVLQVLTESGLVGHLPEALEARYQLVHDYLAAFIHQQQVPQDEALMVELEEEKRRQLVEALVTELEEEKRQRQLTEIENEELTFGNQKARRQLALSGRLLTALLIGVAVASAISAFRAAEATIFEVEQAQQGAEMARQSERDANQAGVEADGAVKTAILSQQQADQAAKEAPEPAKAAQAAVEAAENSECIAVEQLEVAQPQAATVQQAAAAAEQLRASAAQKSQAATAQTAVATRQQQIACEGNQLEQRGNALLRLGDIRFRQAAGLIEALQIGYELKAKLPEANAQSNLITLANYPAYSPLLALRVTINTLAEQGSYEGMFGGFTPDGQGLVTTIFDSDGDGEDNLRLWSLAGEEQASYEGEFRGFTPNGHGLVTVSDSEGKSWVWSLAGEEQASYEGEFRGFTPDGKALYLDSEHGTTTLWSLSSELLAEFTGRMTANFSEDFDRISDDGQYLITSLDDTTHRIWHLDNGLDDLLVRGCNLLDSYFTANPDQREALGICLE